MSLPTSFWATRFAFAFGGRQAFRFKLLSGLRAVPEGLGSRLARFAAQKRAELTTAGRFEEFRPWKGRHVSGFLAHPGRLEDRGRDVGNDKIEILGFAILVLSGRIRLRGLLESRIEILSFAIHALTGPSGAAPYDYRPTRPRSAHPANGLSGLSEAAPHDHCAVAKLDSIVSERLKGRIVVGGL